MNQFKPIDAPIVDADETRVIKNRNTKYISNNLNETERYIVNSISELDSPKLEKCLEYVGEYNPNSFINEHNSTLLHYAAIQKDYKSLFSTKSILSLLLLYGADPTIKDSFGKTAIDYANAKSYAYNIEVMEKHVLETQQRKERSLKFKLQNHH